MPWFLSFYKRYSTLCKYLVTFYVDQQFVRINQDISELWQLRTRAPQGCVPSPRFYLLYTQHCVSSDASVKLVKFSDDPTLIGLIMNQSTTPRFNNQPSGVAGTTMSSTLLEPQRCKLSITLWALSLCSGFWELERHRLSNGRCIHHPSTRKCSKGFISYGYCSYSRLYWCNSILVLYSAIR